jgi:hypothetical protein
MGKGVSVGRGRKTSEETLLLGGEQLTSHKKTLRSKIFFCPLK